MSTANKLQLPRRSLGPSKAPLSIAYSSDTTGAATSSRPSTSIIAATA
jgi:hypothetical protein